MKRLRTLTSSYWSLTVILFVVVLALSFGCAKKEPGEIKIGAILPLTGDAALYGQNVKEGIDLAVEEVNRQGGVSGKQLRVVYEDSQAEPRTGSSAFLKLVTVDKVPAVIGGVTSSVTLAMAPTAEKEKVVILSPAATAPKISEAGDFIFRNWPSDAYEGKVTADYAYGDLGIRKMAVLFVNNDYGKGLVEVMEHEFEDKGGQLVTGQSFEQKDTDFRTQLAKIKSSKAEALYIISYPEETINILRQIKEIRLRMRLLSTSAFQDREILAKAGMTAEGVIYPFPVDPDPKDSTVASFQQNFERKYNKKPGIVCDTGFDAVKMIVRAVEIAGGFSGIDIKRGLYAIRDFHGASGIMSFDSSGDIEKIMRMKTVQNSEFVDIPQER